MAALSVEEQNGSDEQLIELTLPARPESAGLARRTVEQRCRNASIVIDDETLSDVQLIVSELVSNAVRHGRPDIIFRFRLNPMSVDVAVLDHGVGMPRKPEGQAPTDAGGGRGLLLIDSLAQEWGCERFPNGKSVWASVSMRGSARS